MNPDPPDTWSSPFDWLAELDLDPEGTSLQMGTRRLADRPWLIRDDAAAPELTLKRRLYDERPDEVFAPLTTPGVGEAVAALIDGEGVRLASAPDGDPLHGAALSVQEDLCVMARRDGRWVLDGGALHFPSRWSLREKVGRPTVAVHGPVRGYEERLGARVDGLFDRLTEAPVMRRNWFVHVDDQLFQPFRPQDRLVPAADVGDDLVVRSERQTLRAVAGAVLFTIRVQRAPLSELVARRAAEWRAYVFGAAPDEAVRRGIGVEQLKELRDASLLG